MRALLSLAMKMLSLIFSVFLSPLVAASWRDWVESGESREDNEKCREDLGNYFAVDNALDVSWYKNSHLLLSVHRAEVHSANSQEVFTMSSKSGVKVVSQSPQSKVPQSFVAVGLVIVNFLYLPRAFQILFGGFCPGGR